MPNSGIAEAQYRQSASAGPLFLPVRQSIIFLKIGQKMQSSGIAEAPFRKSASAGPLFLPARWSAIISVVRWAADSGPK